MAVQLKPRWFTPEEYLLQEARATDKSEYLDGVIYAVAGSTLPHALIAGNVYALLWNQLRGHSCRPLNNDVRVGSARDVAYFYPDVSVVCGEPESEGPNREVVTNSVAVFEVLSPDTRAYAKGTKFLRYQQIAPLRYYVVLEQAAPFIECHTRNSDQWTLQTLQGLDATLNLDALNCRLPLSEVYERVVFASMP